jgi:O-antigen ligase
MTQMLERTSLDRAPAVRALTLRPFPLVLTCLLLVVSSVAWRKGAFYSGGIDVVVVAKAALTVVATFIALLMRRPPGAWGSVRAAPALWLGAYLLVSIIGGIINADGLPTIVLAGRLALLAFALVLICVSHPWQSVISALSSAMLLLAGFGALTGLGSLAQTGRLYGGIPPLNANEICLLVSVPVVVLFWKAVLGTASRLEFFGLVPLLGVIWLTGSRTGLAGLVTVLLMLLILAPRVPPRVVAGVAAAVPVIMFVAVLTPLVAAFAGRGDLSSVTTLNSRTVAWRAALDYADTPSVQLFGSGLALKQIPVTALYRNEQILDSSWVSALIQAGYVGSTILLFFVLATLLRAFRLPHPERLLIGGLALHVTILGVLESGMFDTAPAFIVFFCTALFAHRVTDGPSG